jgi:hypothetical protein
MALATALPMAATTPMARRLAQPDHAAFIVLRRDVQVHHDLADIGDAGQLVELHVGIQILAGLLVHDALFKQRGADAHDGRAVDLALGGLGLTISPQSCTATNLFILTMPVSVSTETSAICMPPTPLDINPPGLRGLFSPISEILVVPSLRQASCQGRLLDGLSFTWMRPSTAASWSGEAPSAGATAANNFSSAFTVDLRVEGDTPPMVVEPPDAPSGG